MGLSFAYMEGRAFRHGDIVSFSLVCQARFWALRKLESDVIDTGRYPLRNDKERLSRRWWIRTW